MIALGDVLERGLVDQNLLRRVVDNPHGHQPRVPQARACLLPGLEAMAKMAHLPGAASALERAASARSEGGFRGAVDEFSGAAGVAQLGYPVVSLSCHVRGQEEDAFVDPPPTLVSVKSVSTQHAFGRVEKKVAKQMRARNGADDGVPPGQRTPGILAVVQLPGVDATARDWSKVARESGADFTVVAVEHDTGEAREIFSTAPGGRRARGPVGASFEEIWSPREPGQ